MSNLSFYISKGGGLFTLLVSMIGLVATSRRSSGLLRFYAVMLCLAFVVLMGGVACSVRVIFTIYIGVNHSLAVPLMKSYGKDPQSTTSWDNLHRKIHIWETSLSDNITALECFSKIVLFLFQRLIGVVVQKQLLI